MLCRFLIPQILATRCVDKRIVARVTSNLLELGCLSEGRRQDQNWLRILSFISVSRFYIMGTLPCMLVLSSSVTKMREDFNMIG